MNKKLIAHSFNRSSKRYNDFAFVQKEIGQRLIERALHWKKKPFTILDLGCGPGTQFERLRTCFPKAKILELDLAFQMLKETADQQTLWDRTLNKRALIQADMEALPFHNQSIDMIFSNCAFQWSENHSLLFQEIARVLAPDGALFFSTFGPDTLQELREAWGSVDGAAHIHDFYDMHLMGDFLMKVGLQFPVMAQEHLTFTYPHFSALMGDLKGTGATNHHDHRSKGLTPPKRLQKVEQYYTAHFMRGSSYPCTFEVIYGHAIKRPVHPTFCVEVQHSTEKSLS